MAKSGPRAMSEPERSSDVELDSERARSEFNVTGLVYEPSPNGLKAVSGSVSRSARASAELFTVFATAESISSRATLVCAVRIQSPGIC